MQATEKTNGDESTVVKSGVAKGYQWEVRLIRGRHYCGYVRTNFRRPWTYDDFGTWRNRLLSAHGGLTYGPDENGWLGFDCAHSGDVCIADNGEVINDYGMSATKEWTPDDVAEECESLAGRVAAVEEFVERYEKIGWGDLSDD